MQGDSGAGESLNPAPHRPTSVSSTALEVLGLHKRYGKTIALHDLTLTVARGEVFGFLGPNGAGKTTAVKLLVGLTRPTSGTGSMLGRPLGDRRARRSLGYLPELFRFQEWLSATELLDMHGKLAGLDAPTRARRIGEMLELVGLADRAGDHIGAFSKGMQQRVGLAQALINRPELVILDEPTSALDPLGRRDVRNIIQQLRDQGVTVFLNSHLLSEVELVCDRVAFVNHGRVVQEGQVADLLQDGTELRVRATGLSEAGLGELRQRWPVETLGPDEMSLHLTAPEESAEVARRLVALGTDLLEMTPQRSNLERLFLELVEGREDGVGTPPSSTRPEEAVTLAS
jgi:ABC-2 type transport system ATP-binding protein